MAVGGDETNGHAVMHHSVTVTCFRSEYISEYIRNTYRYKVAKKNIIFFL